jgi:hypothetical protein
MEIIRRPIRPEEARELPPIGRRHWRWYGLDMALAGGVVLAAVAGVIVNQLGVGDAVLISAMIAVLLAVTAIIWRNHQGRFGEVFRKAWEQDRADRTGEVEEWTVRVSDAIEVEESGDEGSTYFLGLDDGRVLFLTGQYLYEDEEAGRFPNRQLVLVRLPSSGAVLDLRCVGESFAAALKLPNSAGRRRALALLADGQLLDGPLSRYAD